MKKFFLRIACFALCIITVQFLFTPVAVSAASVENALFPMQYMDISQGPYGSYSHSNNNAMDISGCSTGIDNLLAPFTGTIKALDSNWGAVWIESNSPVKWADGTIDYMTVLTLHDNSISDLYVGEVFAQGAIYCQEGVKSNGGTYVTGNHAHMEVMRGQVGSLKWSARGNVYAYNALYVRGETIVLSSLGYPWATIPSTPGCTTISVSSKVFQAQDVIVSWTSASNAERYGITVWKYPFAGDSDIVYNASLTGTKANLGLLPLGSYCFVMAAYNSAEIIGPLSNKCYFEVVSNPADPIPQNLKASAQSNGSIQLTWGAVYNAVSYDIYRSSTPVGGYTLLTSSTTNSFTNNGLASAAKYYYMVKARVTSGTNTIISAPSNYAGTITAPAKPAKLYTLPAATSASTAPSSVTLSWTAVPKARGYAVYRATELYGTYKILVKTANTTYTNTALTPGTKYFYKVKAFTILGTITTYGYPTAPAAYQA